MGFFVTGVPWLEGFRLWHDVGGMFVAKKCKESIDSYRLMEVSSYMSCS